MTTPRREVSAGGLVVGPAGLLMIQVKNSQSHLIWTFPKGHLEEGETAEQAALREVREETGWRCELGGALLDVSYSFFSRGEPVQKVVHWYRMRALDRVGEWDPQEVLDCRWVSREEAKGLVSYPTDIQLIQRLEKGVDA